MIPRFVMVGGVCALLNNAIVILLADHAVSYLVAGCIAFPPVLLVGYALHGKVTFRAPFSRGGLVRYGIAMLANYPAWFVLMFTMCQLCGVPVPIASPTVTVLLFLWNLASARWIFRAGRPGDLRRAVARPPHC